MRSWIFIVVLQVVACASQPQPQVARYLSGERRLGPPVSDSSYEAYIRGELWFANEQYEASIRAFQRAIDHGPRDPHVMARLAEAMYRSGHSSEAREYLQESLREYPYSESLWLAQSRIMQKENNVYGAISALLRAEHAASLTRDRSLTLVNVLHANGYDHRAVALRRSYLQKKQSVSFGALRGDLLAAVQAQETTWAVQAATRLLNAYPSSADEVRAAARMAYERRVFLAAARLLDQVSRDVPDEVLRVESLIHAGQPRRALAILETSSPDRFGGELVMAKLYLDLGKSKRAQELCDVALAADRNLSEAHFIRGVALYKDERHAESAKEFALVARGSSKYVRAQYELARVLTRMGLHAQALEILEHAISQMPEKSHELREA